MHVLHRCLVAATGFVALAATIPAGTAHADGTQVPFTSVRSVSTGAPVDARPFTVTQAGAVTIQVSDAGFPATLTRARGVVTRGATVVKVLDAIPGATTFDATPGDYVLRLQGQPNAARGAGTLNVQLSPALVAPYAATFAIPAPVPALEQQITIPATGSYTITLRDLSFPQAFGGLTAQLVLGASDVKAVVAGGASVTVNLDASVPGAAAQYVIAVAALLPGGAAGGVYGISIVGGPQNVVVLDDTFVIGTVPAPRFVVNPSGTQPLNLVLADLQFPAPLPTLKALVTSGASAVVRADAPGAQSGTAAANAALKVWTAAAGGAAPGIYSLQLASGNVPLLENTQGVAAADPANGAAYSFPVSLPSAGTYRARVTDFQFPSTLGSVRFALVQGSARLVESSAPGTLDFTAAAGPAVLVVLAAPPAGAAGLLGAEVLTSGTPAQTLLDVAQAVGSVSDSQEAIVTTAGRYDVRLTDLGWPTNFSRLELAVTRGGQLVGKIFNGGTFFVDATPGRYAVTLIAAPGAEGAGTYALDVTESAPTVQLTVDRTSIESGQGVRLTWSSTAATSCTATEGWSGSRTTSGNESVGPLSASARFTLTCTGPGGTAAATASVEVRAAPSGGGGGGALGAGGLFALALLAGLRQRRSAATADRCSSSSACRHSLR